MTDNATLNLNKIAEGQDGSEKAIDVKSSVRRYVQENFFLGAAPNRLEDATPLITSGIVDSIGMIGLVAFIEERFKIEFLPTEINVQGLDTLDRIETLVRRKLEPRP